MNEQQQSIETLKDIRRIMDRSSRLISLSGLSGVGAGLCALIGAWVAGNVIEMGIASQSNLNVGYESGKDGASVGLLEFVGPQLLWIAFLTFAAAVFFAFLFTWLRSRKNGMPLFGPVTYRLILAVGVPIFIGFLYLLKLLQAGAFGLVSPGCLLFYGLGLVNASRYTTNEIRYLGYAILIVGITNLFLQGYGLYFWALGFGVLHIVYGIIMWYRYER